MQLHQGAGVGEDRVTSRLLQEVSCAFEVVQALFDIDFFTCAAIEVVKYLIPGRSQHAIALSCWNCAAIKLAQNRFNLGRGAAQGLIYQCLDFLLLEIVLGRKKSTESQQCSDSRTGYHWIAPYRDTSLELSKKFLS